MSYVYKCKSNFLKQIEPGLYVQLLRIALTLKYKRYYHSDPYLSNVAGLIQIRGFLSDILFIVKTSYISNALGRQDNQTTVRPLFSLSHRRSDTSPLLIAFSANYTDKSNRNLYLTTGYIGSFDLSIMPMETRKRNIKRLSLSSECRISFEKRYLICKAYLFFNVVNVSLSHVLDNIALSLRRQNIYLSHGFAQGFFLRIKQSI